MSKLVHKIVRVADVAQRLGDEFIDRPAENASQCLIRPKPPEVGA
jgi:hypothetical protein